ncbi:MAG: small, acid-soluble spore protein, alpha/beta type [Bacillota bacterium]
MPSKKQKTGEELLREKIKLEIAEELGLLDKIKKGGWGELNAVESGKIGGILSSRLSDRIRNQP